MRVRKRDRSVSAAFYFSYAILLVVILLLWLFSFGMVSAIYEKEVIGAMQATLDQGHLIFAEKLTSVSDTAMRTLLQPDIVSYMRISAPLIDDKNYDLLRRCNNTFAMMTRNDVLLYDRIFIYFHGTETFIGDFGASTRGRYAYDYQYQYEAMDYESWRAKLLAQKGTKDFWPVTEIRSHNSQARYLTFLYSYNDYTYSAHTATTMAILISENTINNCFQSVLEIDSGHFLLLKDDGTVLYSSEAEGDPFNEAYAEFLSGDEIIKSVTIQGNRRLLLRGASRLGIVSLAVVDYQAILARLAPLNRMFGAIFLSALILGALLSFYFTQVNAKPIRRISRMLHAYYGEPDDSKVHINTLGSSIDHIIHINREMAVQLEDSRCILRNTFLEHLFQSEFDSENGLIEFATHVNLTIPKGNYVVAMIRINTQNDRNAHEEEELLQLFHIALSQCMNELPTPPVLHHTEGIHRIAALFCWTDGRELRAFANDNLRSLSVMNIDGTEVALSVGLSCAFTALMETGIANAQASFALDFPGASADHLLFYQDIPIATSLYYPIEKESALTRMIRSGNAPGATDALREIFTHNYITSQISEFMQRQLMYDLCGTFFRLIDEMSPDPSGNLQKIQTDLISLRTPISMVQQLEMFTGIIHTLCETVAALRSTAKNGYIDQVLSYIQTHCTDPNLSLQMAADAFHLSQAYLSRQIRVATNETFSDLLEKHRMNLAQRYVTESNENMTDIAAKCGYWNNNTFFKAFKRYYGVSPSVMRRQNVQ